jgi:hypothetical protein
MVNWTITATTILCARIKDEVTVLVYKDGSVRCTTASSNESKCDDFPCPQVIQYRDCLFAEEKVTTIPLTSNE